MTLCLCFCVDGGSQRRQSALFDLGRKPAGKRANATKKVGSTPCDAVPSVLGTDAPEVAGLGLSWGEQLHSIASPSSKPCPVPSGSVCPGSAFMVASWQHKSVNISSEMYKTLDRYFGDQNEKESPYANIARAKSRTCPIGKGAGGEETGRRALPSFKVEFTPERWVAFFFRLSD